MQGNKIIVPMNYLMLLYLAAETQPLFWLALPLGAAGLAALIWFDNKSVMEEELAYWTDRNPRFRKMIEDIEEIKVMMRE